MRLSRVPLALLASAGLLATEAFGRDLGQWGEQPSQVRPDNPYMSCCGEADAYQAESFEVEGDHYVAIITNGDGDVMNSKPPIPNGTRIPVPNYKMKFDDGNPTGHGVLFLRVGTREVYCYVTPGGV